MDKFKGAVLELILLTFLARKKINREDVILSE